MYGLLFFLLFLPPTKHSNNQVGVLIEWLREGTTILSGGESSLSLSIPSVSLSDAGLYSCKATLNNGTVLGPVNAGRLRVFGKYAHSFIHV